MYDSILNTIKPMVNVSVSDNSFDTELIADINTALFRLNKLGVGPENGFMINDENASWYDFMLSDTNLESIKTYVFIKTKLLFDPPPPSAIAIYEKQAQELEWLINASVDKDWMEG